MGVSIYPSRNEVAALENFFLHWQTQSGEMYMMCSGIFEKWIFTRITVKLECRLVCLGCVISISYGGAQIMLLYIINGF